MDVIILGCEAPRGVVNLLCWWRWAVTVWGNEKEYKTRVVGTLSLPTIHQETNFWVFLGYFLDFFPVFFLGLFPSIVPGAFSRKFSEGFPRVLIISDHSNPKKSSNLVEYRPEYISEYISWCISWFLSSCFPRCLSWFYFYRVLLTVILWLSLLTFWLICWCNSQWAFGNRFIISLGFLPR